MNNVSYSNNIEMTPIQPSQSSGVLRRIDTMDDYISKTKENFEFEVCCNDYRKTELG